MGNIDLNCSLKQEMAAKAAELVTLREERSEYRLELTLHAICTDVESKEAEIVGAMTGGKGQWHQYVRQIVEREIRRSAAGRLWCPAYDEKARSNQRMMVYTGSHWEQIESQQWKDFVGECAERCGLKEAQLMNHSFMKSLYEGAAFIFSKHRRQRVPPDEVWLNMSNGTLVVNKDGSVLLREHRKEDLFTYTLNYAYDPQATCVLWHGFINRVLPSADTQAVLAEFIGYTLMKTHELEKMLWLYGEGLNGKSVTLEMIEALLGSENVSFLSLSDLTNDDVKRAGIEGKMLNISHESGKDVNANVLKQLTSGEYVTVKHLYQDPRETNAYGKFSAAFNQLPRAEVTFGYFRRLIILPYMVTIPQDEIDRQLTQKLKQELPGILNWVLAYLPAFMQRCSFTDSDECEKALDQYRLQSDNVRLFVQEMCEASDGTTHGSEVFKAYQEYCQSSSLKAVGKQKFYDRMLSIGFAPVLYGHTKYFNLKLLS